MTSLRSAPDEGSSVHPVDRHAKDHVIRELQFAVRRTGDGLTGSAAVTAPMHTPLSSSVRISVLAIWVDMVAGLLAVEALTPKVPVTIELDVHLAAPAPGHGLLTADGRALRSGRAVFVSGVELAVDGVAVGVGGASFTTARDPSLTMPLGTSIDRVPQGPPLAVPLAQRVGLERLGPGQVVLPCRSDGINAAGTLNGGLIALAAEEAALSLAPGRSAASLALRYLRPVRKGPLVASGRANGDVVAIELRDAGHGNRLAASAVVRLFPDTATARAAQPGGGEGQVASSPVRVEGARS